MTLGCGEVADILLNAPQKYICPAVPTRVQNNYTFIVDMHKLAHERDINGDDNGTYKSSTWRPVTVMAGQGREQEQFCVSRLYSTCTSSPDFTRMIYRIKRKGQQTWHPTCLINYRFKDSVHPFTVKQHGRSKRDVGRPFKQTAFSVRETLKQRTLSVPPSAALSAQLCESGGMAVARAAASVPRNYKQAENFRSLSRKERKEYSLWSKDVLSSMMQQCKLSAEVDGKPFVRRVQGAPEPLLLLATEKSLQDLERFCCSDRPHNSVLAVDPTFSLGNFYVTPTTFENKALVDVRSGKHPISIGPTLIHYRKLYSTYHYLASGLVGERPRMHATPQVL